MALRVIAGEYKGRRLQTPAGDDTRPTADGVREALFSMLGPLGEDDRVLDLFAGSGALGIEALSRGAGHATFCDDDRRAIAVVRANLEALGIGGDTATTHRMDARSRVREARTRLEAYDLVFLDPPYLLATQLGEELQDDLAALLAAGGRIVTESGRRSPMTLDRLTLTKERRYGTTLIRIYSA
ncbi:MAG: methyltransferase [Solirubrobacterales bacterium]|nr:methyltransferase [Solirubrobacterales bacterium]